VPKLWSETLGEHRREVADAILETTHALVEKNGLRGVTMSLIAEQVGIGRATLYKYFADVETILVEWHQRHVAAHLEALAELREGGGAPVDRLRHVLETYALIRHEHDDLDLTAMLQRHHVEHAHAQLHALVRDLIAACAKAGAVRDDVPPAELATFCLHALSAAAAMSSRASLKRLVDVTIDGLLD
jgi:AcrR family transcriptional regulator